jgi:hypothetical protein
MRALVATLIYLPGLVLLMDRAIEWASWPAAIGVFAIACVWSFGYGLLAGHRSAIAAPVVVSGACFVLFALLVAMLSSGGGADSDFTGVLIALLAFAGGGLGLAIPVWIGVEAAGLLDESVEAKRDTGA